MSRQIVITLPEWTEIKQIDNKQFADLLPAYDEMLNMIKNGTPLPENHGRLIDESQIEIDNLRLSTQADYVYVVNDIAKTPTILEGTK